MSARCLICKAFIRKARSTRCKRCGAWNGDTSLPVATVASGPYTMAYTVAWAATTNQPGRFAWVYQRQP